MSLTLPLAFTLTYILALTPTLTLNPTLTLTPTPTLTPTLTRLLCFATFHLRMVLLNETTIEGPSPVFNVGKRKNWESVMGKNPTYWLLPLWGEGPNGDGVHWPTAPADDCGSDGEHVCDNVHLLDSTCGSDSESV